ncbi:MAG TPA: hypothetical protein VFB16_11955 [Bauldia sp.]|nr:hypothetical protein [Bauldia sp.]
MKRHVVLAALLLAPAVLAPPALAATAEEAVGYAFFGLAAGGSLTRGTTTMNWTESGASPAIFESEATVKGRPAKLKFTVTASDPCHYQVDLDGPPAMVPGGHSLYARISLAELTHITPAESGYGITFDGDGFCQTNPVNPKCQPIGSTDLLAKIDSARHAETVTFLAGICAPKP